MIRAGQRPVEGFDDPHVATAARTGWRIVLGRTVLVVPIGTAYRLDGHEGMALTHLPDALGEARPRLGALLADVPPFP